MSSKRGRKRNDTLPPNRARDVQRAFRARRAAHLQALEQRVSELEEENGCLRQALNLPPSDRPPLGKGPTGKDKINTNDGSSTSMGFYSSRESSSADSPLSRESSESPSAITVSMSSRPMTVIEYTSWNESPPLSDHQRHQNQLPDVAGPSDASYQLGPMSPPLSLKPAPGMARTNAFPSTSRALSNNQLYIGSPNHYTHSSDRPMENTYDSQTFDRVRNEMRDESPQQYTYFPAHDSIVHSQSPAPPTIHSHNNSQRESPLPYPSHKQSLTDPQGFSISQGFPHLPNPVQPPQPRTPEYMRQSDNMHLPAPPGPGAYGSDDRLNYPVSSRNN